MFGSEILDVAIGLVFLFLLLSLVCSSLKESMEAVSKYRARDLERGLREMLGDASKSGLVAELYNHPLINGLYKGSYDPNNKKNLPSYIPSRIFALALTDLLKPSQVIQPRTAAAAEEELKAAKSTVHFRTIIATIENASVKRALLPLVDAAGEDIASVRKNIEDWYNSAMDRVAGWYKRRTQQIIVAIALVMAALMNIDTVAIARYLNTNQTARSVMVARFQASRDLQAPASSELVDPMGWLQRQGGLPVGWVFAPAGNQTSADFQRDWRRPPSTPGAWLLKALGILFTTFAVSLGAPFWFDVLNKFMVVRSTVKPQEKSAFEKSKD